MPESNKVRVMPLYNTRDTRSYPVTPVIPPAVATNDVITAAHENQVTQALSDLWTDLQSINAASIGAVPSTRQVIAGSGLSGGGALSADVTLTLALTSALINTAGGVITTGSYPNPAWITSLAYAKITGAPATTVTSISPGTLSGAVAIVAVSGITVTQSGQNLNIGNSGVLSISPGTLAGAVTLAAGANVTVTQSGQTITIASSAPSAPANYWVNGTLVAAQPTVNFINGANVTITGANNTGANRVDITIASSGAGSATPAGSDQQIQLNKAGAFGADAGLTFDYTNKALAVKATTTPGAVTFTSDGYGYSICQGQSYSGATGNSGAIFNGLSARGSAAAPTLSKGGDYISVFRGQAYNGSAWGTAGGIYILAESDWSPTNTAGCFSFYTGSGSGAFTERMRITSAGNVGIGITNPPEHLSLSGNSDGYGSGAIWMSMANVKGYLTHLYMSTSGTDCLSLASNYRRTNDSAGTIGNTGAGTAEIQVANLAGVNAYITFGTGGNNVAPVERMRITSAGNVGIGTANPQGPLQVAGQGSIFGANNGSFTAPASTTTNIVLYWNSSVNWAGIGADGGGHIYFRTGTSGTPDARMVILSTGNVGIGTTSPWGQTVVAGSSVAGPSLTHGTYTMFSTAVSGGTELSFVHSNVSPFTISLQTRSSNVDGSVFPLALNPLGGNVGIGTTSPNALLQLGAGTPTTAGAQCDIYQANQTATSGIANLRVFTTDAMALDKGGSLALGGISGVTTATMMASIAGRSENNSYAGYFQICTMNSAGSILERMRITSAGNVGIGLTSPQQKLEVNGAATSIAATGSWIDANVMATTGCFYFFRNTDTSISIRMRGSDGYWRQATFTLA